MISDIRYKSARYSGSSAIQALDKSVVDAAGCACFCACRCGTMLFITGMEWKLDMVGEALTV